MRSQREADDRHQALRQILVQEVAQHPADRRLVGPHDVTNPKPRVEEIVDAAKRVMYV